MRIHILGIGGTFMAGIAMLARAMGHTVTGSDMPLYPPMSDQLAAAQIPVFPYTDTACFAGVDLILIGNALSRGNPAVEWVLNERLPYTSAPQWLASVCLHNQWVIAVTGTHGKTTTTSMIAWILDVAGHAPGFLIGGMPQNFGVSARLGAGQYFVIEADEYDTAFFDKQPKFMHVRPRTAVINTVEYDHADIYPNLASIQRQFHYLIRTVPGNGVVIRPVPDRVIDEILAQGVYSPVVTIGIGTGQWSAKVMTPCAREWQVWEGDLCHGTVHWTLPGLHNVQNGMLAIAAAHHAGVAPAVAIAALSRFERVKRRLESVWDQDGIRVFDDFAHHPTAVEKTLQTVRSLDPHRRIIAILDVGTRTMQSGVHTADLGPALAHADRVILYKNPRVQWAMESLQTTLGTRCEILEDLTQLRASLEILQSGDDVVLMSNSGTGSQLREAIVAQLTARVIA